MTRWHVPRGRVTTELAVALVMAAIALAAADDAFGVAAVAALLALVVVDVPAGLAALIRRRRPRAVAQVVTMAALLVLVLPAISYVKAMTAPSNSSFGIRSVEWLRSSGGAWLVSDVEDLYYSLTAPSTGGPALRSLPSAGVVVQRHPRRRVFRPRNVRPVVHPALPGEGVWHATQRRYSAPPVLVTTYRPSPLYPRVVAGLAWIDPRRARLALYPGLQEPPGSAGTRPAEIPQAGRSRLIAAFNSGFKHSDGGGGFYARGSQLEPMQSGLGTIAGMANGSVDIRAWNGGHGVVFARQNLPLLVDGGRPNPSIGNGPQWGATVGRASQVWRSGIGIDRHGDLIYAAADYQTADSLARILIHAGAVRAIELDINSYWISFITYGRPGAGHPRQLLPDMVRPATRYLTPDDRDFFAVYAR